MRVPCENHHTPARDNQYRSTARYYKDSCPYCRIVELEQQLAEKDKQLFEENLQVKRLEQKLADEQKAAGHWMEQSCKDHNRAEKLEKALQHYQGGIEVEGFVNRRGLLDLDAALTDTLDSQRVRVLVMKEEV